MFTWHYLNIISKIKHCDPCSRYCIAVLHNCAIIMPRSEIHFDLIYTSHIYRDIKFFQCFL